MSALIEARQAVERQARTASVAAAIGWLARMREVQSGAFVWEHVLLAARRSLRLEEPARAEIVAGIGALMKARCTCPHCGEWGTHSSNGHHRVLKEVITCGWCSRTFKIEEAK